jgi:hypothetical protein
VGKPYIKTERVNRSIHILRTESADRTSNKAHDSVNRSAGTLAREANTQLNTGRTMARDIKKQTEGLLCDFLCDLYGNNQYLSARDMKVVADTMEDFLLHWRENTREQSRDEGLANIFGREYCH